jgi:hypothetical protein
MTEVMSAGSFPMAPFDFVIDNNGNYYVVGEFFHNISYGGYNLSNQGNSDGIVAKFSSNHSLIWAKTHATSGYDETTGVVLDSNNNVLVTGHWGVAGIYVSKLSSSGSWMWNITIGSTVGGSFSNYYMSGGIVVDSSDNVYITGKEPNRGLLIRSFSSSGSALSIWYTPYHGTSGSSVGNDIQVGPQGNIYVLGTFFGTVSLCNGCTSISSTGFQDVFIAKINPNSSGTGWLWTATGGSIDTDIVKSMVVDSNGSVYISGQFTGTASFGGHNVTSYTNYTCGGNQICGFDPFIAKALSNGSWSWAIQGAGPSSTETVSLTIDDNDNIYALGYQGSAGSNGWNLQPRWLTFGVHQFPFNHYTGSIMFVFEFNSSGIISNWSQYWESPSSFASGSRLDFGGQIIAGNYDGNLFIVNEFFEQQSSNAWGNHSFSQSSFYIGENYQTLISEIIRSTDLDNDTMANMYDHCPAGVTGWTSNNSTDLDSDGCKDTGAENSGQGEDIDDDSDSVLDQDDLCPSNYLNWSSNSTNDYDADGCHDVQEDLDDDNDGIDDFYDLCSIGALGWFSNNSTDYDSDGCLDAGILISGSHIWGEDLDTDNDGVTNWFYNSNGYPDYDNCPYGQLNWISNSSNDYDSDGCIDITEDNDDDDDGVVDMSDLCTPGVLGGPGYNWTDWDSDGCHDSQEDTDDDNDGVEDVDDDCITGDLGWTSNNTTDWDSDGCYDFGEDDDDDNDGVEDVTDLCFPSFATWQSNSSNDYDTDGCHDSQEDTDDDNDGVEDVDDDCITGDLGWTSNNTTDWDSDGCYDFGEDDDDDNDGVEDVTDLCFPSFATWQSNSSNDYDTDGCHDSQEDTDDDNDGVEDVDDDCITGDLGWTSNNTTDWDSDGCYDFGEDDDDDNDGVEDVDDDCITGDLGWTSNNTTDWDSDGCYDLGEDDDDDNDGWNDSNDSFPFNAAEWIDTDEDGVGNNADIDDDGDGWTDIEELNCGSEKLSYTSQPGNYQSQST